MNEFFKIREVRLLIILSLSSLRRSRMNEPRGDENNKEYTGEERRVTKLRPTHSYP